MAEITGIALRQPAGFHYTVDTKALDVPGHKVKRIRIVEREEPSRVVVEVTFEPFGDFKEKNSNVRRWEDVPYPNVARIAYLHDKKGGDA